MVTTPRSPIDVRIFAIASGGGGGGGAASGSALHGVLLAAKTGDGSGGSLGQVVSEDFVVRDTKSSGERWVFPCTLAASAAAAPYAHALLALLASCSLW